MSYTTTVPPFIKKNICLAALGLSVGLWDLVL